MRAASVVIAALLLVAPAARAEERAGAAVGGPDGPRRGSEDGRRTLERFPANLARGLLGVIDADNLFPFLVGGTATAASSFFDDDLAERIADPGHDFGSSLEDGASPEVLSLAVAGVFAAGRMVESPRFRAFSYDLADAFLVNWAWTSAVKVSVGRERPDGSNDKSFPSGHTSNAFALAAVAERHYGWKAGIPAYVVASLVGVSRLQRDKHYLSDVLAGATLGYLVGRAVVRANGGAPHSGRGAQVSVGPVLGRRTRALVVVVSL